MSLSKKRSNKNSGIPVNAQESKSATLEKCIADLEREVKEYKRLMDDRTRLLDFYDLLELDPGKNIEIIIQQTWQMLGGACAFYSRFARDEETLYYWSTDQQPAMLDDGFTMACSALKKMIDQDVDIPISCIDMDSATQSEELRKCGFQSLLGCPVRVRGKTTGLLALLDFRNRIFTQAEIAAISIFAKALSFEERKLEAEKSLRDSERKHRIMIEHSNDAIFILQQGMVKFHNRKTRELMGYSEKEIATIPFIQHVHPEDCAFVLERHIRRLNGEIFSPSTYPLRVVSKTGEILWGEVNAVALEWEGERAVMCFIRNITKQKKAELALLSAHRYLEERVAERTSELAKANEALKQKTKSVEEVNTALKVLLEKRQEDRSEMEENVLLNVKGMIMPYLDKLGAITSSSRQTAYIDIIRKNLNDIISPFGKSLSSNELLLTPTEIEIANLVRHGKSSKDIAANLSLSLKTVAFHRENIREKLGLKNKKVNLRTHLLSLR